jgi:hypothetical protein
MGKSRETYETQRYRHEDINATRENPDHLLSSVLTCSAMLDNDSEVLTSRLATKFGFTNGKEMINAELDSEDVSNFQFFGVYLDTISHSR